MVAGARLNTHQALKLLALAAMTLDHVGTYLYPDELWLRAIGRLCVPVWFFLIGHALRYRVKRETILWALALVVLQPLLGDAFFALNVLVTIIVCQLLLHVIETRGLLTKEPYLICFACVLFSLPGALLMEYGTQGLLFALMGYAVRSGQMTWRTGKLVSVVALGMFLAVQLALLEYTPSQMVFIVVGVSLVTLGLAHFVWRPVRVTLPQRLERPCIWLSRHSLQYYVLHQVLLAGLGLALGISTLDGWHWVEEVR